MAFPPLFRMLHGGRCMHTYCVYNYSCIHLLRDRCAYVHGMWHAEQPEIGLMALVLRRAVAQSIGGAQLQGTAHTALQRPPKRKDEMTVLDIRPRGLAHHIIVT